MTTKNVKTFLMFHKKQMNLEEKDNIKCETRARKTNLLKISNTKRKLSANSTLQINQI